MTVTIENCPNPQAIVFHTSFNLNNIEQVALKIVIEMVDGVEEVHIGTSKYHFLITIGKMFDRKSIGEIVKQKIEEFIEP